MADIAVYHFVAGIGCRVEVDIPGHTGQSSEVDRKSGEEAVDCRSTMLVGHIVEVERAYTARSVGHLGTLAGKGLLLNVAG